MAKNWTITELKQKIEDDISDENARKSILKLFANVIEKNYDINPSNWNVSYRTGGSGLRFQLNFGHKYVLGVYADSILVMNKRETFLKLPRDFISEILKECEFANDGTNKTAKPTTVEELENYPPEELWHNSIQFKIPFANCEKYLETLEPAICDFAKWCTENRKKNPQSEDAHVSAFIDYLNQELETDIPQPEYEGEWNPDIEEQLKLYKDFQAEFPIAKIRNLTLKEYNNTERKNAFCYWIETRLRKLGSIQGSTSYKFGIYEYNENPRDDNGYSFDGQYAWLSKYGKSSDEAYEKVHSNIINIIEAAQHGDLDEIEKIDISPMFKWKIAFLYSDFTLMNIFSREGLVYLANKYGLEFADKATLCELYQFLLSKKGTEEHILKYSARIWNEWVKSKNKLQGDTQMAQEDTLVKKYANLLKNTKNLILTGAPGTGKTYLAKQIAKELGCKDDNIGFVQFHPSYDYTDFVEGLRPKQSDNSDQIGFERKAIVEYMKKNLGLLDYKKTESTQKTKKNFVFIIDEINRGEVAKIFGELFYCVDPGYRGEKGRISTQYQNLVTCGEFQKGFFIPENVYIIGTMNDIDRSVESMDFAFRRRFTWAEVKASDTVDMLYPSTTENGEPTGLESKELADEAKRRMENLNNAISKINGLNEAYHIGASYFLKLKNYDGNQDERFECLWEYHIKGILQEYLRGNPNGKIDDLKAAYDREDLTK